MINKIDSFFLRQAQKLSDILMDRWSISPLRIAHILILLRLLGAFLALTFGLLTGILLVDLFFFAIMLGLSFLIVRESFRLIRMLNILREEGYYNRISKEKQDDVRSYRKSNVNYMVFMALGTVVYFLQIPLKEMNGLLFAGIGFLFISYIVLPVMALMFMSCSVGEEFMPEEN